MALRTPPAPAIETGASGVPHGATLVRDPVIALVDDDPLYLDYLAGLLSLQGFTRVRKIGVEGDLDRELSEVEADCVLIDNDLGRDNGFNVATRFVNGHADPPPVIMMTGTGSERTAIKAFRLGFADYVSKRNLTSSELSLAINAALIRTSVPGRAGEPGEAEIDERTGLARAKSMRRTLAAFAAQGENRAFSVMLVEPTGMAALRERLGLVVADRAYRRFVCELRARAGPLGFVGHWDKGRFLVLSDSVATPHEVLRAVEDLAQQLSAEVAGNGARARLDVTVGAVLRPPHAVDPDLVARAVEASLEDALKRGVPCAVSGLTALSDRPAETAPTDRRSGTSPAGRERRAERRMRCLKRARVLLPAAAGAIDCTVLNHSPKGLRLRTLGYFAAPEAFEVEVLGSGERRHATLRWQIGQELGVELDVERSTNARANAGLASPGPNVRSPRTQETPSWT